MWWHPPTPMAQASILDCFGPFRGLLGRQHRKLCATAGFPMARLLFRMQRKPEQEPTGLFGHEQEQTDTMDPKGQVGPTGADAGFRFGQTCFDKKKKTQATRPVLALTPVRCHAGGGTRARREHVSLPPSRTLAIRAIETKRGHSPIPARFCVTPQWTEGW